MFHAATRTLCSTLRYDTQAHGVLNGNYQTTKNKISLPDFVLAGPGREITQRICAARRILQYFFSLGIYAFIQVGCSQGVSDAGKLNCMFESAQDDLDASPEKVIFVGDNPVADIQGANNLGMYTIYIPGNYGLECNSANAVCTDYRDFPGIVDKAT